MCLSPTSPVLIRHASICNESTFIEVALVNNLTIRCNEKHRSFVPRMDIVGLPDAAVVESKQRVQPAIKNALLPYPHKRLVINLAPATQPKGSHSFYP